MVFCFLYVRYELTYFILGQTRMRIILIQLCKLSLKHKSLLTSLMRVNRSRTPTLIRLARALVWLTMFYLLTKEFKNSSSEKEQTWRVWPGMASISYFMHIKTITSKLNETFLLYIGCYGVANGRPWRWYVITAFNKTQNHKHWKL